MAELKQINIFATKWREKICDQKTNYVELIDGFMGDDCKALGFEMDWGAAFLDKYGEAINDPNKLGEIINKVTDIPLLGSAIFSKWRYFNHWAYSGSEIMEPTNREWFIIALSRLMLLSAEFE